jgi:hypothetical protein
MPHPEGFLQHLMEELQMKWVTRDPNFQLGEKGKETLNEILQSIEDIGFQIIPAATDVVDDFRSQEVSSVIATWLPEEWSGEASEIPGAQILQHLQHTGWIIIPPK